MEKNLFTEKSGGFPSIRVYQICLISQALFNTAMTILTLTASSQNTITQFTFFFSLIYSFYSYSNLIIKLKIEDISKYEVKLVHKDSKCDISWNGNDDSPDNPIFSESIALSDFRDASICDMDFEQYRISEAFLNLSEKYFASSKHADQQVELLRQQLKECNVLPLEYIPLPELKQQLNNLITKMNKNEITEQESKRLDYLLICLEKNPEYISEQEMELQL